jgi:FkbM family methyltransferase
MEPIDRFYRDDAKHQVRTKYKLNSSSLIIDLGGYKGEWALEMYQKYKCLIRVYEPIPEFHAACCVKVAGLDNFQVHCAGVGDSNREEELVMADNGTGMFAEGSEKIKIKVVDIIDVIKDLPKVDLIKLNIEGMEFEVLESLIKHDMLKKFINLQIQFHRYGDDYENRYNEIKRALKKTHHATYCYEWVWENWCLNA